MFICYRPVLLEPKHEFCKGEIEKPCVLHCSFLSYTLHFDTTLSFLRSQNYVASFYLQNSVTTHLKCVTLRKIKRCFHPTNSLCCEAHWRV